MSFLNWFSSTPKLVDTACDLATTAAKGIDAIFYTDEEKAEARKAAFDQWLEAQRTLQAESSVRSITRRVLAFAFCGSFLGLLVGGVCLFRIDPEWGRLCFDVAKELSSTALAVVVFYFGPTMISRAVKDAKG